MLLPSVAHAKKYKVKIKSSPSGATVYIGSKKLGKTPLTYRLEAGEHSITVRRAGYDAVSKTIDVKRSRRDFSFKLEREQNEFGVLHVKSAPGLRNAKVHVDGVERGVVPLKINVKPGPRQIEVIKKGYEVWEEWIDVDSGETKVLRPEAVSTNSPPLTSFAVSAWHE